MTSSATNLPAAPRSALGVNDPPKAPPVQDVWSRSGRKYRVRAIVLLWVNILLFSGVASFAYWLRSGVRFAPLTDSYFRDLADTFFGVGRADVSLGSFLLEPVSVLDVPMQIPIVGLLMASLIAIPILVALLYRFWSSVPFVLLVGMLAVMPWLAATLLLSCVLASVRPFRARIRFVSALVALVPVAVYLVLAWMGTDDALAGRVDPVERMRFIAPWVLAVVAAVVLFAIVLSIARLVNYRPGAITPLLALMFGLPVILFESYVGRDELYYRLIASVESAHFAEVDAGRTWEEAAWKAWHRHPRPRPSLESIREIEEQKWLFELMGELGPHESELAQHQAVIVDRCDWFLKYFPDSRYAVNVLFLKARSLDMRVDGPLFRERKLIRFYCDFPSVASKRTWRLVAENGNRTPLGAVAQLRLAQLVLREGDVDRAAAMLRKVLDFEPVPSFREVNDSAALVATASVPDRGLEEVLGRDAPQTEVDVDLARTVFEARRLLELIEKNRDPLYGYEPLTGRSRSAHDFRPGLADFDARHERYLYNLLDLLERYPKAQLTDNIELEIAKATPAREDRIRLLRGLLRVRSRGDAAAEALYRLSDELYASELLDESLASASELVSRFPESMWARAVQRLHPPLQRIGPIAVRADVERE